MTTGFQFAHIDWYSQKGAPKRAAFTSSHGAQRGRGWSNAEILAEATRQPGHCGHVQAPTPPTICHGSVPLVEDAIDAYVAAQTVKVKTKSGEEVTRKARADSPSMAAGVISFPRDRIAEWPAFRDHAIEQLKQKHGDRLRCVLEHLDEAHPHLHFYLVPEPGERFGVVHDGYEASREARKQPENKIRTAFNDAMSRWQDWVNDAICSPFGLARVGPARRRMSRKAWKADEVERLEAREREVADREAQVTAAQVKADKLLQGLERRSQLMIQEKALLATNAIKDRQKLDRLQAETEKARDELVRLHASLTDVQKAAVQRYVPNIAEVLKPADGATAKIPAAAIS